MFGCFKKILIHSVGTVLLLGFGSPLSASYFGLIHIDCSGNYSIYTPDKHIRLFEDGDLRPDYAHGWYYQKKFYAPASSKQYSILTIDLSNRNFVVDDELNKIANKIEYSAYFHVIQVDSDKIIYELGNDNYYKFDRHKKTLLKIPIQSASWHPSIFGERIYYSTKDSKFVSEIYYLENEEIKKTGLQGEHPSISPDGTKLVYIQSGKANTEKLLLTDLKSNATVKIKHPYFRGIDWRIRWSPDSRLIAYRTYNELTDRKTIYIYNIESRKTLFKIQNTSDCNWFLLNTQDTESLLSFRLN